MALPVHKYYSLEKAAKVANCDVSDLIHFASIGVLQICMKILPVDLLFSASSSSEEVRVLEVTSTSTLSFEGRVLEEESKEINTEQGDAGNDDHYSSDSNDEIDETDEYSRHYKRFSYKSDYFSITERYEINTRKKEIENWSGLLAIPQEFIESDENYLSDHWDDWDISVDVLLPPRCDSGVNSRGYSIGYFYMDDWHSVNSSNLYITHYELGLLMDGGRDVNDAPNKSAIKQVPNSSNIIQPVNKRVERHAANREALLKSAIYILSKYPDECRGERKEISPEKWRDCLLAHKAETPPLIITNAEVILKHLRNAVNGKLDS